MQAKVKKLVVLMLGWSLIALGVIGLFLPVLQGLLFLLIGLFVLSSECAWARRMLQKLRSRFPTLACRSDEATRRANDWLGRLFSRQGGAVRREASQKRQEATRDSEWVAEAACTPAGPGRDLTGKAPKHKAVRGKP